MTVKEIILNYLKDNNFDGLCRSDLGCGCGLDNMFWCDALNEKCECAYKHKYTHKSKSYDIYCPNKQKNNECKECDSFKGCEG